MLDQALHWQAIAAQQRAVPDCQEVICQRQRLLAAGELSCCGAATVVRYLAQIAEDTHSYLDCRSIER
jgi:hypothetical protein